MVTWEILLKEYCPVILLIALLKQCLFGISYLSVQDKPKSSMGRFLIAIYVQNFCEGPWTLLIAITANTVLSDSSLIKIAVVAWLLASSGDLALS
jgi:hypothetical protein